MIPDRQKMERMRELLGADSAETLEEAETRLQSEGRTGLANAVAEVRSRTGDVWSNVRLRDLELHTGPNRHPGTTKYDCDCGARWVGWRDEDESRMPWSDGQHFVCVHCGSVAVVHDDGDPSNDIGLASTKLLLHPVSRAAVKRLLLFPRYCWWHQVSPWNVRLRREEWRETARVGDTMLVAVKNDLARRGEPRWEYWKGTVVRRTKATLFVGAGKHEMFACSDASIKNILIRRTPNGEPVMDCRDEVSR